jgi:hypothetical protein
MIANMNGSIKIIAYDGDKILVEVTKSIFAKTEARLERAKQTVDLKIVDRADTLILYTQDACNRFGKKTKNNNRNGSFRYGWGYQWDQQQGDCDLDYDYKMDFIVKVPASVHVMVSTINDGDIEVENMKGVVLAGNINGSIRLTNLQREAEAHTINGDVDITYSANPKKDCRFYTLNGDINALFPTGLAANMSFESFNGNFYTNIDKLESLPLKVEKASHGEGIKYKINGSRYQIGSGGALLDFETFNGNVYLKEKKN